MFDVEPPRQGYVNPFKDLTVGDWFDVEAHRFDYTRERNILNQAARRLGMRIRSERTATGFRVWRAA